MHRDGTGCSYRNASFAEPSSSHYFLTFYKTLFSFSHMIANVSSVQSMLSVCLTYSSGSISPSCITCRVCKLYDILSIGKLNILFRVVKIGPTSYSARSKVRCTPYREVPEEQVTNPFLLNLL